jgi:nucleoside-diphosphate-sugar epimerase
MADRDGRILVTGACGQIGSELTMALRDVYGGGEVVAVGHVEEPSSTLRDSGPHASVDVRDYVALDRLVDVHEVDAIYHMAAILSAAGEKDPWGAWDVNVNGLLNVLEIARTVSFAGVCSELDCRVRPRRAARPGTAQNAPLNPRTMYGITKLAGEALARHYAAAYGLDVRGLRYPGIITSETMPSGGTTDYTVEIFYAADSAGHYQCFVREDTVLPMMYVPDCVRATLDLMNAPREMLSHPERYNVAGMSFSAGDLAKMIQRELPGFTCSFVPDGRQVIADSWPMRIDDRVARHDWNWRASYSLEGMVSDMLQRV